MIIIEHGNIQSAAGTVVSNGSIGFILNTDGTVIASPGGFVSSQIELIFQLDNTGNIVQPAQLYSNAELDPQNSTIGLGTWYEVCFYTQSGARINQPLLWQFTQPANSTVDIGTMVPFSPAYEYPF